MSGLSSSATDAWFIGQGQAHAIQVAFSGAVSGSAQVDANGFFGLMTTDASLGQVSAVAVDDQGVASDVAATTIAVAPPTVTLSIAYGAQRQVTLTGQVSGVDAGGIAVSFTGKVTGSVVTDAAGTFSFTAEASGLGDIQAVATDSWGSQSDPAVVTVASMKPVITNFNRCAGSNARIWIITGSVVDESPAGLVISFSGADEVEAEHPVVRSNGNFVLVVEFAPGFGGIISAQTTDWWGLTSDPVYIYIS